MNIVASVVLGIIGRKLHSGSNLVDSDSKNRGVCIALSVHPGKWKALNI